MTAVVGGLPRSWQTAPSITVTLLRMLEIVDALRAPGRRPSACGSRRRLPGCHSGSCGQPTSASSSGKRLADRRRARARAGSRSTAAAACSSSFSISPQIRSAGRSSSGIVRHSARVCRLERAARTAPRTGRARSTRRLSSPNVRGVHGAQHAALEVAPRRRTDRGTRRSADRSAIALMVKSRRRAASVDRHVGIAVDGEAAVPAAGLRIAARQRRRRRPPTL